MGKCGWTQELRQLPSGSPENTKSILTANISKVVSSPNATGTNTRRGYASESL